MATKHNDICLKKALDDEELFILMARDTHAPETVIEWIKLSLWTQPEPQLREAFESAMKMKNTIVEVQKRKYENTKG